VLLLAREIARETARDTSSEAIGGDGRTVPIRLLYTSSGAVYGRSTPLPHTPETYTGGPDPLLLQSSYDEAKRMSEHLCIAYARSTSSGEVFPTAIEPVIARCFAFVGPHLPLDQHFAIGNFIGAAMSHRQIHVRGDGTPRRSWLYMADLAVWLWTLLARGQANRAYNVGSDEGFSIAEAARLTAATLGSDLSVQIDGIPNPDAPLNSYVPSIERAREELGLRVTIPLGEAIRRTAAWHKG
jgi:dTDP-glucose 4,6-dehydratase